MEKQTIDVEELRRLADAKFWEAHKKIDIAGVDDLKKMREAAGYLGQAEAWQYLMGYLNDYSGNGKS